MKVDHDNNNNMWIPRDCGHGLRGKTNMATKHAGLWETSTDLLCDTVINNLIESQSNSNLKPIYKYVYIE